MPSKLGENIAREWSEEPQATQLWDALELADTDSSAGIEALSQLAESGSSLSMMYLGSKFLHGQNGLPKDETLAESWLRRAAEAGSIEGAFGLAWLLHHSGQTDAARREYMKLADRGYSPALYCLGASFYFGSDGVRKAGEALRYLRRGEELGHYYATVLACHILMRGEEGFGGRVRGFVKWLSVFIPTLRTAVSYPASDRIRRF